MLQNATVFIITLVVSGQITTQSLKEKKEVKWQITTQSLNAKKRSKMADNYTKLEKKWL